MKLIYTVILVICDWLHLGVSVSYTRENFNGCYSGRQIVYCAPFFGWNEVELDVASIKPWERWQNIIYPQYREYWHMKNIPDWVCKKARKEAAEKIKETERITTKLLQGVHPHVYSYWKLVRDGEAPEGCIR